MSGTDEPPERPAPPAPPSPPSHPAGEPVAGPPSLPPVWSSPSPPPRERPSPWPALLGATLLAVLVGAIVLVLLGERTDPSAVGPTPTPAVTPSVPAASPSPGPTPSQPPQGTATASPSPADSPPQATIDPEQLAAEIARVEAQVPPIRGLEPREEVEKRFLDAEALAAELRESFAEDNPPELVAAQQALYRRLGLLPPDADLEALVLELYGAAVAGFYDPDTGAMTVVQRSEAFGPLEKTTIAHEFTHALQDQHFDLASLGYDDPTQGDRSMARLSLVEGDATLLMSLWAQQHLTAEEILELLRQSNDPEAREILERMPPVLVEQTLFPYTQGLEFAAALHQEGGWEAIDRAFGDLPESTEQVIHPERYLDRDEPVAVVLPDLARALGEGWQERLSDTMGELNVRLWVEQALPSGEASDAAEGWDGDRIALLDDGGSAWAIGWVTAWDGSEDAAEFGAAARSAVASLGGEAAVDELAEDHVAVVLASDATVLAELRRALRGG